MPELILIVVLILISGGSGYYAIQQRRKVSEQAVIIVENQTAFNELQQSLSMQAQKVTHLEQQLAHNEGKIEKLKTEKTQLEERLIILQRKVLDRHSITSDLRAEIESREQETQESRAFFSTVSNVTFDIVFVLDEDTTIISLNRSADILFSERHPIGEKLADVISAPDLIDIVDRAMTESESLEEQVQIDDQYYRARIQVMRYDEQHTFIGVALQDISQLVRLNRARRDLVGNISHELRTPISNIRLIIDGLFMEQDKPKRKASIESLRAIRRHVDTLELMSQELLDLSMIESGQAILKMVNIPLAGIVEEAVMRLEDQLEAKELTVVQHIPDKIEVLCDRDQTRRVLVNLIHNAIKWSPEKEAITVSATNGGEEVTIRIFDNGPGVPDSDVTRIFERFYQVDSARTSTARKGTGLGLAICKHIIHAHGGEIWAESNANGAGGRFIFTLLSAVPPSQPQEEPDSEELTSH